MEPTSVGCFALEFALTPTPSPVRGEGAFLLCGIATGDCSQPQREICVTRSSNATILSLLKQCVLVSMLLRVL